MNENDGLAREAEPIDVDKLIERFAADFESKPFYSQVDDRVEFYYEDADHYRDRIAGPIILYRAFDDHRIVGFSIKCPR